MYMQKNGEFILRLQNAENTLQKLGLGFIDYDHYATRSPSQFLHLCHSFYKVSNMNEATFYAHRNPLKDYIRVRIDDTQFLSQLGHGNSKMIKVSSRETLIKDRCF
ncbi:hypothetical protein MAR_008696 [Mya arenaria]|uniref:Uncharacterized protein n=1 Tax=Mya arenaria TaxID=6604 RepID=A0ABY7DZV6_MYAAR|nr:hypothetical protein MAR_008696 [Mya arenaria]